MLFQDEEIFKGEKKIYDWRAKLVGLQNQINNSIGHELSGNFEDMLLLLDKLRIKVEELKNSGQETFESIRYQINEINNKLDENYKKVKNKL